MAFDDGLAVSQTAISIVEDNISEQRQAVTKSQNNLTTLTQGLSDFLASIELSVTNADIDTSTLLSGYVSPTRPKLDAEGAAYSEPDAVDTSYSQAEVVSNAGAAPVAPTAPATPIAEVGLSPPEPSTVDNPLRPSEFTATPPDIEVTEVDPFTDKPPEFEVTEVPEAEYGDEPELDFGTPPDDNLLVDPPGDAPTLPTRHVPSDVPGAELPPAPSMREVVIPTFEGISIEDFTYTMPVMPDIDELPDFNWGSTPYVATLEDPLTQTVTRMLAGELGMPDAVWDHIWEQGRVKLASVAQQEVEQAAEEWSSRGFQLPTGMLIKQVQAARDKAADQAADQNREQVIQRAKTITEQLALAVTQGIVMEGMLRDFHIKTEAQALEAAKAVIEMAASRIQIKIAVYNATVQALMMEGELYAKRISIELAKLEAFKSQIEAQKLIGQINLQDVEVYKAQVAAADMEIRVFNAQVDAVKAQIDADKSQIDIFSERIRAFGAGVSAKEAEWRGYAAKVQGEVSKMDGYVERVRAESAKFGAYESRNRAESSRLSTWQSYAGTYNAYASAIGAQNNAQAGVGSAYEAQARAAAARISTQGAYNQALSAQHGVDSSRMSAYGSFNQAAASVNAVRRGAVDIFAAQAQGYAGAAQAYAALVRADAEATQTNIEAARMDIERTRADIERFRAASQAEINRVETVLKKFQAETAMFEADIQEATARASVGNSENQVNVEQRGMNLKAETERLRLAVDQAKAADTLQERLLTGAYSVAAQLQSAAMAAMNFSSAVGYSGTDSSSYSQGISKSFSRDYGVNVSVPIDEATGIDLDPPMGTTGTPS